MVSGVAVAVAVDDLVRVGVALGLGVRVAVRERVHVGDAVAVKLGVGVRDAVAVGLEVTVRVDVGDRVGDNVPVALRVGVMVGENVGANERVGEGDGLGDREKVTVGVEDGLRLGVRLGVTDCVNVDVAVREAVTVRVAVKDGDKLGVLVNVGVTEAVDVREAVAVGVGEREGVLLGEATIVSAGVNEAVREAVTEGTNVAVLVVVAVELADAVGLCVGVPVGVRLGGMVTVGVRVRVGAMVFDGVGVEVGVPVFVCVRVAEGVRLAVAVPVCVGVSVQRCDGTIVGVGDGVRDTRAVWLAEGVGVARGVSLGERSAVATVVGVGEATTDAVALGVAVASGKDGDGLGAGISGVSDGLNVAVCVGTGLGELLGVAVGVGVGVDEAGVVGVADGKGTKRTRWMTATKSATLARPSLLASSRSQGGSAPNMPSRSALTSVCGSLAGTQLSIARTAGARSNIDTMQIAPHKTRHPRPHDPSRDIQRFPVCACGSGFSTQQSWGDSVRSAQFTVIPTADTHRADAHYDPFLRLLAHCFFYGWHQCAQHFFVDALEYGNRVVKVPYQLGLTPDEHTFESVVRFPCLDHEANFWVPLHIAGFLRLRIRSHHGAAIFHGKPHGHGVRVSPRIDGGKRSRACAVQKNVPFCFGHFNLFSPMHCYLTPFLCKVVRHHRSLRCLPSTPARKPNTPKVNACGCSMGKLCPASATNSTRA